MCHENTNGFLATYRSYDCGLSNSEGLHNKGFEKSIYSMVKDQNNKYIKVKSIADFKWDKAYLFEPYTPQELIEKQLGVEYDDPSNISSRDDIYLIIFLKYSYTITKWLIYQNACS